MAEKKKRFEYKLTLGKHPVTGETIRRSFYSTKSLRDAKRKAEEFKRNYEMELMVEGVSVIRNEKFSAWALSCLETYKKPYVKAKHLRRHISGTGAAASHPRLWGDENR